MLNFLKPLTKLEKIVVAFLALTVLVTGTQVVQAFYTEHSKIVPEPGGVYTEGAIGSIELINPVYVRHGSVTHDLVQLIFSGLTQYDPESGTIIPDLANFTVSDDKKTYTFVIKENATWHDGTPVTSDDVFFTYNDVIQNPSFRGAVLNYNDYSGVKVRKVDERTIEFLLEDPDSFFLVKTLTGILPQHLLGDTPVTEMELSFFNQFPTGSGRYRLASVTPVENHTEVTLEAYEDFYGRKPHIPTILIKVFPTSKDLLKNVSDLDGIRQVPDDIYEKISERNDFTMESYHLPQYVALFMNTESDVLQDAKVRLALQLGTNKTAITGSLGHVKRVDTPLLEIDQASWVYQHDIKKANGALFDTQWKLPKPDSEEDEEGNDENEEAPTDTTEADTESEESEEDSDEENEPDESDTTPVTYINNPNGGMDWKTTDSKVTITGTVPDRTKAIIVNDYELKQYVPGQKGWSYIASEEFGNLKPGRNVFKVYAITYDEEKQFLDSIAITYGDEQTFNEEARQERLQENSAAPDLPTRINEDGESLTLNLITSQQPEQYEQVARMLKDQWKKIGVDLQIDVLENSAFQERLSSRNYDLLIFGQNLGYNLDAYPYWHSSQAKEGGFNLSQFKNFIVDSLLDKARLEHNEEDRKETLNDIQEIMRSEVPAVFLYSPTYHFALSESIQNATLHNLATTSDRFAGIESWYASGKRKLKDDVSLLTFFGWLGKQL